VHGRQRILKKNIGTGTPYIFEMIALNVQLKNQYEGANVKFKIFPEGSDVNTARPLATVWGKNEGGKASAEWAYRIEPGNIPKEKPKFIFTAESFGCANVKAEAVQVGVEADIICIDEMGKPIANKKYTINGKEGKTGSNGELKEKNLAPGFVIVFELQEK